MSSGDSVTRKVASNAASIFGSPLANTLAQLGAVGIMFWILMGSLDYIQQSSDKQLERAEQRWNEVRAEHKSERDALRKEAQDRMATMWGEVKAEREKTRKAIYDIVMELYEWRMVLKEAKVVTKTFSKTSPRLEDLKKSMK